MEKLSIEQMNKILRENKTSLCMVCVNKGVLMSNECAAYIAVNENDARAFFEAVKNDLPANEKGEKEFSVIRFSNFGNAYELAGLFNRSSFKYINIINYGIFERENLIVSNDENINYIITRINGFLDNAKIYSLFTKENRAFSVSKDFRQLFFSNLNEAEQVMKQYNNDTLGLYPSWIQLDSIVSGNLNELLKCTFDGRDCTGYDMIIAAKAIFNNNQISKEEVKEIYDNNKICILATTDGSNYVMRQLGNTIFFTSDDKIEEYKERNKYAMTHKYEALSVKSLEAYKSFIELTNYISFNGEKHCSVNDFMLAIGLS